MHRHPNGFADLPAELFGCPHETSEGLNVKRSYMYADPCGGQSHKECEIYKERITGAIDDGTGTLDGAFGRRPREAGSQAQGDEAGCRTAARRSRMVAQLLEHAAAPNKEWHDCTYTALLKSSQYHSFTIEGYSLPKSTVKLILTGRS